MTEPLRTEPAELAECQVCGLLDDPEKTIHPCDGCGAREWALPEK